MSGVYCWWLFHRTPQNTLAGQARKPIFLLEKYVHVYVYKFTTLTASHMIDLFDKLILPILNYCSEVRGFIQANAVGGGHLQFCKQLHVLGVKKGTQMWRVKRICVFEHSVMTNFNCACPAIQRGQGSGFLAECSS